MTGDKKIGKIGHRGTTLVELMVTISVFSIFITVGLQLLTSALLSQQKALEKAEFLNQASYSLDYITRCLRMTQKDLTGNCIAQKFNYENPNGNLSAIRFLNSRGKCVEVALEELGPVEQRFKAITVKKSTDSRAANLGGSVALTSKGISVEGLNFKVTGQSQNDLIQPSVSVALKIKGRSQKPQEMLIQTSVSQRELDVQY